MLGLVAALVGLGVGQQGDRIALIPGKEPTKILIQNFVSQDERIIDAATDGKHLFLETGSDDGDRLVVIDLGKGVEKSAPAKEGFKWNSRMFVTGGKLSALVYSEATQGRAMAQLDAKSQLLGYVHYTVTEAQLDAQVNSWKRDRILDVLRPLNWYPKLLTHVDGIDSTGLLESGFYNFMPNNDYCVWLENDRKSLFLSDLSMEEPIIMRRVDDSETWKKANWSEDLVKALGEKRKSGSFISDGFFDGSYWYLNFHSNEKDFVVRFGDDLSLKEYQEFEHCRLVRPIELKGSGESIT